MENRFCTNCGAKLVRDAAFCVECGEAQGNATVARRQLSFKPQRHAPALVILAVVAVGGAAVVFGLFSPKEPPRIPGGRGPQPNAELAGRLPPDHPPVGVPDEVKHAIEEMAARAAAAPEDMQAWKQLAEVQYRAGQFDRSYLAEAEKSYRHMLEREPENLDVLRGLGNIAFDRAQADVSIDFYQRYLKLKPDDAHVQTDLGTMYLSAGQTAEAVRTFESVLEAEPSFFQAQFNLAIAYRSAGQHEAAIAALEKASAIAPDEQMRTQVDQLLARVREGTPAAAPAVQEDARTDFHAGVEAVFRQHPVVGPKMQRLEWTGPREARLYLRDFPMEQMGEDMQTMFFERVRERIREQKHAHNVTLAARVDLIDEASGRVMGTIME